jgi:hypothetical protein
MTMSDLLERAGFRLRRRNRADCIHCPGRSRGTVSFNSEVAHCFRCGWKANTYIMARDLGLLADRKKRVEFNMELAQSQRHQRTINRFERWRSDAWLFWARRLSSHRRIQRVALSILSTTPDCEPALEALALTYHQRSEIETAMDVFACQAHSTWLERDMTIERLFDLWRADGHGH